MRKVSPSGGHGAPLDQMWVGESLKCETQDATCVASVLLRTAASGFLLKPKRKSKGRRPGSGGPSGPPPSEREGERPAVTHCCRAPVESSVQKSTSSSFMLHAPIRAQEWGEIMRLLFTGFLSQLTQQCH